MSSLSSIDYEQLVLSYNESLATVLRGFRPAADFLESWVHDEDNVLSLLNIIESAELAGEEGVLIHIGPTTLSQLELPRLKKLVEKIGIIETSPHGDGLQFKIVFKKHEI